MTRAWSRIRTCLERQSQHAGLNAFIKPADPTRLQELGNAADGFRTDSLIHGRPIAVKDNIVTAELPTTAASKILDGFRSPYSAKVVELLGAESALICGKTNLDEFGMGSHTRPPFTSPTLSPFSRNGQPLSAGGSSGGSAVAVATGQAWAALGTDTGGSVRLPAAYTGTVGFKPSYGRLSRYGVIAYANSLDTVGTLTQNVEHARTLYYVLDVPHDEDPTCLTFNMRQRIQARVYARNVDRKYINEKKATQLKAKKLEEEGPSDGYQSAKFLTELANATRMENRKFRIGVPLEYNTSSLAPQVRQAWSRVLTALQDAGHSLHPVSLLSTHQALSAYYVIAPAEASSNLAKYDGVRYGYRHPGPDANPEKNLPLFAATRGEGFGSEVQRRILLGTYTLSSEAIDNYFLQAQRVRRLVQKDFNNVFALQHPLLDPESEQDNLVDEVQKVDVLIAPTAPTPPPTMAEVEKLTPVEMYMNDVLTVPASLAGLPALSVPVKLQDHVKDSDDIDSVGMQIIGQFGDDEMVLDVGQIIEDLQGGYELKDAQE